MEQHKTLIRPGLPLDITDRDRHMKSIIYDAVDHRIIIAQTSPPLTKYNLNKEISLSFNITKGGQTVRYLVKALITDFIYNYKIASTDVIAVGLKQMTNPAPYDHKPDVRIHPPSDCNLAVEWKNRRVTIDDISAGGLQFIYRGRDLPLINQEILIKLIINGDRFNLAEEVLGITMPASHDSDLHHIRTKFTGDRRDYQRPLMKKIIEIQRSLIADGRVA